MEKARNEGVIDGFEVERIKLKYHMLSVYCSLSGLKLNLTKSKFAGINMEEEKLMEWAS